MRKNKMLRMASALLILVLLTTSVVGGTFAKYVTTAKGTDTARVAKWGVEITANGTTFASSYANDAVIGTTAIGDGTSVATSEANTKLVAPGTKGNMAKMTLSGTPEVAVRVSYTGEFEINDKWVDKDGNFYCPLTIKLSKGSTTENISGASYTSKSDFETAVNNAIKGYQVDYEPNTDLSTKNTDSLSIDWEWPFSSSAENDVKDTYLGGQAAANPSNAATVTVAVTTTVTQID